MAILKADRELSLEEITTRLQQLRENAHEPISGFSVAAIMRFKSGSCDTYYATGVNVENPDHRTTPHAEEGCIASMTTAFGKNAEVREIWVMGAPTNLTADSEDPLASTLVSCCGKCRQQIVGVAPPSTPVHSIALNGQHTQTTVGDFLTNEFSFRNYIPGVGSPSSSLDKEMNEIIHSSGKLSNDQIFEWIKKLESVDYVSKSGQAVILRLSNGHYVAGVNVEDAAFVSINPIQSAIASAYSTYKNVVVEELWTASSTRKLVKPYNPAASSSLVGFSASKEEEVTKLDKTAKALSLSNIQMLTPFLHPDPSKRNIPMHFMSRNGETNTKLLSDCLVESVFPVPELLSSNSLAI